MVYAGDKNELGHHLLELNIESKIVVYNME